MNIASTIRHLGAVLSLSLLAACGGGGGGDGSTPPLTQPPAAPTLSIGFGLKQISFNWPAVNGATHYRLLQNPDGASGFIQAGANIAAPATGTALDIAVHRHDWANARFLVEACNSAGCSAGSNEVTTAGAALNAIGYFKASNTGADDRFGGSVALSADGKTLAVGASQEASNATGIGGDQSDDAGSYSGAVYVFTRSGSTWAQQAYIKASNTGQLDHFGESIALSADGNTLAVGAYREQSNATGIGGNQNDDSQRDAGAVYVYSRNGPTWTQQAYVKASNTEAEDAFGISVALSADGNTLAVSATNEASNATGIGGNQNDNSASGSGAVYVFTRSGSAWAQQAYVKASNTGAGDRFGTSLALSADGTALAVGALFESSNATGVGGNQNDDSASRSGAVYVFTRGGSGWTQQAYVKASNTAVLDRFGTSLALSADGNTLAVGAYGEGSNATGIGGNQNDNSANVSGAVYVFIRSGSTWAQQAYVKASNTEARDLFGTSLALSTDGNTLAVGAYREDSNATGIGGDQTDNSTGNGGAVYVFTRSGADWAQRTYVKASNTGGNDEFGESLALSADGSTLAVGAIFEASAATGINNTSPGQADNSTLYAGAVYLY